MLSCIKRSLIYYNRGQSNPRFWLLKPPFCRSVCFSGLVGRCMIPLRKIPCVCSCIWNVASRCPSGITMPYNYDILWVWAPPRMPVPTKIITFSVGGSRTKPSFTTITGRGPHPRYIVIVIVRCKGGVQSSRDRKHLLHICSPLGKQKRKETAKRKTDKEKER